MSEYPPERSRRTERERSRRSGSYTPRRQKPRTWVDRLPLVFSIVAVILAGAALVFVLRGRENEPHPVVPEEPVTFQYRDRIMTPLEGMPTSPYDKAAFSRDEKGRVVYEKDGKQAKTGVDVSVYQKEIDWQAVAADGIDFAIIRLGYRGYTEGGLFMDESFSQNIQGALNAGLEVGVYFFSQAITPEEAEAEAAYILNALDGYETAYPITFDWEPISAGQGARTDGLDGAVLTRCAAAFCRRIEETGRSAAVYFNQDMGYLRYDLRELTDYVLWLAEYDSKPDFYYRFDLWQYTHTGQVAGIEGEVDLNLDLR